MSEAVVAEPPAPLAQVRRKAIAVAAFLFAALFLYYLDNLPSALDIDDHAPWKAQRRSELILYGLPGGQVFEFNGAQGSGLDVRASTVRLSDSTLGALGMAGVALPATKGTSLSWLGRTDATGKINLTVRNERDSAEAGLSLVATGNADIPQLRLTPIETALTITLSAPAGDSASVPAIGVRIGNADVPQPLATMMPMSFELPPGQSISLTFPSAAAMNGASFRLGVPAAEDELASDLPLDRFVIGPRRSGNERTVARVEQGVCAAEVGRMLLRRLAPSSENCGRSAKIAVQNLDVTPAAVAIEAAGSGFVIENGKVATAGLLTKIANNKLVAALLGLACAALAGWVWKTLTGMGKT